MGQYLNKEFEEENEEYLNNTDKKQQFDTLYPKFPRGKKIQDDFFDVEVKESDQTKKEQTSFEDLDRGYTESELSEMIKEAKKEIEAKKLKDEKKEIRGKKRKEST